MFFTDYTPPNYTVSQDPMAAAYMAGDGLKYFPNRQFLTSSDYGAFRTPSPAADSTSVLQQQSLLKSFLVQNSGRLPGFSSPYAVNVYDPSHSQHMQIAHANRRVQDAGAAFSGTIKDTALALAPGLVGGFAGLAVGAMLPNPYQYRNDYFRDARINQNVTSSSMVAGPSVSASTGQGLSLAASMQLTHGIRLDAARDTVFGTKDYNKILDLGVKAGMFDHSSNVHQYKDTLKLLMKNFTTFMDVLQDADPEKIVASMQRLQRMGVSANKASGVLRNENMFARMIGVSHEEMISTYGQQGALIFAQKGLTGYTGTLSAVSNAASISLGKKLGLISPGELSRIGGMEGGTQKLTDLDGTVNKKFVDYILPAFLTDDLKSIDKEKLTKFKEQGASLAELTKETSKKISGRSPAEVAKYFANKDKLFESIQSSEGDAGMEAIRLQLLAAIGGMGDSKASSTADKVRMGAQSLGIDAEVVEVFLKKTTDPTLLKARSAQGLQELSRDTNKRRNDLLQRNNIFNRASVGLGNMWSGALEWAGFKTSTVQEAFERDFEEAEKTGTTGLLDYVMGAEGFGKMSAKDQRKYFKDSLAKYNRRFGSSAGVAALMSEEGTDASGKFKYLNAAATGSLDQRVSWEREIKDLIDKQNLSWDSVAGGLASSAQKSLVSPNDFTKEKMFSLVHEVLKDAFSKQAKETGSSVDPKEVMTLTRQLVNKEGLGAFMFGHSASANQGLTEATKAEYAAGISRMDSRLQQEQEAKLAARYDKAFSQTRGYVDLGYDYSMSGMNNGESLRYAHEFATSGNFDEAELKKGKASLEKQGISVRDIQTMAYTDFDGKQPTKDSLKVALTGVISKSNPGMAIEEANSRAEAILKDDQSRKFILHRIGEENPEARGKVYTEYADAFQKFESLGAEEKKSALMRVQEQFNNLIDTGANAQEDRGFIEDAASTDPRAYGLVGMQAVFSSILKNPNASQTEIDNANKFLEKTRESIGLSHEQMMKFMDAGSLEGLQEELASMTGLQGQQVSNLAAVGKRLGKGGTVGKAVYTADQLTRVGAENLGLSLDADQERIQEIIKGQMTYTDFMDPRKRAEALSKPENLTKPMVNLLKAAENVKLDPSSGNMELQMLLGLHPSITKATDTGPSPETSEEKETQKAILTTLRSLEGIMAQTKSVLDQTNRRMDFENTQGVFGQVLDKMLGK